MTGKRKWIARGLYVYWQPHDRWWIGVQSDFPRDGYAVNVLGVGLFIGNDWLWHLQHDLRGFVSGLHRMRKRQAREMRQAKQEQRLSRLHVSASGYQACKEGRQRWRTEALRGYRF